MNTRDDLVGKWLSAAMEDPAVCREMKADIELWFNTATTVTDEQVAVACAAWTPGKDGSRYSKSLRRVLKAVFEMGCT